MGEHGVEIWSGGAATWECDANGHLNVRHHVAKSMEALASFTAELGMPRAFARSAETTLVVREQHIRFLREVHAAQAIFTTGGVLEMGETDARLMLTAHHLSGQVAAVFQVVVEHVTASELRPFPWPERVRQKAAALKLSVPPELAPRSIPIDPVTSQASHARALELGLTRTGLGVITEQQCDSFGRMRAEMLMSRISDGIQRVTYRHRTGAHQRENAGKSRIGGAALEYRLVYLDWPTAGDRVELRSGTKGCDARFRRLVHWLVDPDSGKPWGSAEAVVASFDLEARKILPLSEETQAAIMAEAVPGLAL